MILGRSFRQDLMIYSTSPFSFASKIFLSSIAMGCLSFQLFRLLSMITKSAWNINGRLRLFSSSMESWRFLVIAGAMVFAVSIKLFPPLFVLWVEFFAPMDGTHTHL